jgi:hypothetical protein
MNSDKLFDTFIEQQEELISILLNSSLYQDMAPEDKQELLSYLTTSYFSTLSSKNSRALPPANAGGPTI